MSFAVKLLKSMSSTFLMEIILSDFTIGMIKEPEQKGLACERRERKKRKSDNFSIYFRVILFS